MLVNRKDVLDAIFTATSTFLETATEGAMEVLKQMMNYFTCLDVSINTFSRTSKDSTDENLDNKVDFLLPGPTYNTRSDQNFHGSSHERCTEDYMSRLV